MTDGLNSVSSNDRSAPQTLIQEPRISIIPVHHEDQVRPVSSIPYVFMLPIPMPYTSMSQPYGSCDVIQSRAHETNMNRALSRHIRTTSPARGIIPPNHSSGGS